MGVVRRVGCLLGLVWLVAWLAVLGGLAWFGYQAYRHVTDATAITERIALVGAAWAGDPTALTKAASGAGGVRPASLSPQPFQEAGARAVTAYHVHGATLTLTTTRLTCDPTPLTVQVVETPVAVGVLVHADRPWLPPVRQWWDGLRTTCVTEVRRTTLTATLGSPRGRRVVVDAVTGASVRRV